MESLAVVRLSIHVHLLLKFLGGAVPVCVVCEVLDYTDETIVMFDNWLF